jgi:ribonuclease P protein component
LFKSGDSFSNFPLRILYFFLEDNIAPLQSGFTVSAKVFKKAVDRNRIKRLMREAYRLEKNNLTAVLKSKNKFMIIFFIYTGTTIEKYNGVANKMNTSLKKLNKIVDENNIANN